MNNCYNMHILLNDAITYITHFEKSLCEKYHSKVYVWGHNM